MFIIAKYYVCSYDDFAAVAQPCGVDRTAVGLRLAVHVVSMVQCLW